MFVIEAPVRYESNCLRDENIKVLQFMLPICIELCVVGKYIADDKGRKELHISLKGVPYNSKLPSFAAFVLYISNLR